MTALMLVILWIISAKKLEDAGILPDGFMDIGQAISMFISGALFMIIETLIRMRGKSR